MVSRIMKTAKVAGEKSVIRILCDPFGDPSNRDLHGDFFHKGTDFKDDLVAVQMPDGSKVVRKMAVYEHLFNEFNNPHMKHEHQYLGSATLAEIDDKGRWFDFEVDKGHEFHDFILALAEMKMLGSSTQCLPNGRRDDPNVKGKIDEWAEAELSALVTPAAPVTVGTASATYKSFKQVVKVDGVDVEYSRIIVQPEPVTDFLEHLKTFAERHLSAVAKKRGVALTELVPALKEHPAFKVTKTEDDKASDEGENLDAAINDILGTTAEDEKKPEEKPENEPEPAPVGDAVPAAVVDVEAIKAALIPAIREQVAAEVKAGFTIWMEMWGNMEEAPEAIRNLMKTFGLATEVGKSVKTIANFVSVSSKSAAQGFGEDRSAKERELLEQERQKAAEEASQVRRKDGPARKRPSLFPDN